MAVTEPTGRIPSRMRRVRRMRRVALLASIVLAACEVDAPTRIAAPTDAPLAGRGGGGTSTTAPTVTSVDPPQAPQDTTLDVTINGSGFTTGARAAWSLGGDTTQVHVLSTKVVSAGRLVARITVPSTAPLASYDVEVMLGDGKKGVGAEMFLVTERDPSATFLFPLDDATLGVRSDRLFTSGSASAYVNGVCGTATHIFATTEKSNSGDATLSIGGTASGKGKCSRWLTIDYGDGVVQNVAAFMNVNKIHNTTSQIAIGTTARRGLNLADTRCNGLRWKTVLTDGTYTGADSVNVTRTSADTWVVETQPPPLNKAFCVADGRTYHISARFTIVASEPLP
jgi:hypothetical protein